MSSILFLKFAIVMIIALFAVAFSSKAGGGIIPIFLALALGLGALVGMRLADRAALSSSRMSLSSLYSSSLSSVKEVKHLGDVDLLRAGSEFIAIAGLEVVDAWNVYEVLSGNDVANLSHLHGEVLAGMSGCEVHIEVSKTGEEPRIRYFVLARARSPEAARSRASAAIAELSKGLSALQIAVKPLRCGQGKCSITGLGNHNGAPRIPTSMTAFIAQGMLAAAALALSPLTSPAMSYFALSISIPALVGAIYGAWVAKDLGAVGPVAPQKDAPVELSRGRLRIGGALYSFAALRYIEHYDRVITADDVARLVGDLNSLLYSSHKYLLRIAVRAVEEAAYRRKEGLKMDMAYLDFETGGGLSRKLKSHKHEVRLERMRVLGERPFEVSGILILNAGESDEGAKVIEGSIESQLRIIGLKITWVRSLAGILRVLRYPFLGPSMSRPLIEPPSVEVFNALTMDFAWISPVALDRSPLLAKDGVYLGRDKRGRPVYWNPLILRNNHLVILGPPGSGKSTIVRSLILRAHKYFHERYGYKPTVLIIDPAGEYRRVAKELGGEIVDLTRLKVNPLMLEGATPHDRASSVVEMLRYAYALKGEEKVELKDAIIEAYRRHGIDPNDPSTWLQEREKKVTMGEVYKVILERLEAAEKTRDPTLPALKTLADKLRDLCEGARALDRTDITVSEILRMSGLLCLSFKDVYGAMGLKLQQVVVWTILEQLRSRMLADEVHEQLRVLVVIDEGHRFTQLAKMVEGGIEVAVEPPLSLHLRDVRKFGVGYIVITHNPKDMPEDVIPLFGTTVAMSSSNVDYLDWAARNLQLTPAQREELGRAGLGRGYLLWMDDPRPLLVSFEPEKKALIRDVIAERAKTLVGEAEGGRWAEEVQELATEVVGEERPVAQVVRGADVRLKQEQPLERPVKLEADEEYEEYEELIEKVLEESINSEGREPERGVERGGGEVEELAVASLDMGKGFCPKCHKKTPSWARFCSHCGHELVEVKA